MMADPGRSYLLTPTPDQTSPESPESGYHLHCSVATSIRTLILSSTKQGCLILKARISYGLEVICSTPSTNGVAIHGQTHFDHPIHG
jgi:hypothetical protein